MRLTATFLGLAVVALAAAAPPLYAADNTSPNRRGLHHRVLAGRGGLEPDGCDDCGVAAGGEFHLGAMASRSVAVIFEGAAIGRGNVAHGMAGVGAQWWPSASGRFWLRGGVGVGALDRQDDCDFDDFDCFDDLDFNDQGYLFASAFGAVGVEVVRTGRFTMDVLVRGACCTDERNDTARSLSVNVGFNWY